MGQDEAEFFLGIDASVRGTTAAVADATGVVVAATEGPGIPVTKSSAAKRTAILRGVIEAVLGRACIPPGQVSAVAAGISGAESSEARRQTEAWVNKAVAAVSAPCFTECPAILSLRAATRDAVGVGLVAEWRTTCVGRDRYGRRHSVGGHGAISGDVGYAEDLAMRALGAAWMASDGRAGPSSLSTAIPDAVGVGAVRRLPELFERGELPSAVVQTAVDCLFAEAELGDGLAQKIIEDTGQRLGAAAVATLRALSLRAANAVVVLDGSMFTGPGRHLLVGATRQRIRSAVSEAHVIVARSQRVVGAILFARDLLDHAPLAFADRLRGQAGALETYRADY